MNENIYYIGLFVATIATTILIAFLVNQIFLRLIRNSTQRLNNDLTNYQFLRRVLTAMIYLIGFSVAIYLMPNLRALASSLLAGAGILALAVGFASQHALGNIISGIFIVIFKPFRVNDRLTVRNLNGVVEDITLRHTVIRDFENKRILIPNTIISDEIIINADFTEDKICRWIDVKISYDSDIDKAKAIIQELIKKHPFHVDPRTPEEVERGEPEVVVRVLLLDEYSVNLRAWAWAKDAGEGFVLSCDLYESIKKEFDENGIDIPFPHRTLIHKESSKSSI